MNAKGYNKSFTAVELFFSGLYNIAKRKMVEFGRPNLKRNCSPPFESNTLEIITVLPDELYLWPKVRLAFLQPISSSPEQPFTLDE